MKVKNIVAVLFALVISPLAFAGPFTVINSSNDTISVSPYWNGQFQGWTTYEKDTGGPFDSGMYSLKQVMWKSNGQCYRANVEGRLGSFSRWNSEIIIRIYNNGALSFDLGKGETPAIVVPKDTCMY